MPTIAAAACGCVLTLVTQWLFGRRAPKAAPPPAEVPSTVEQWQPDAIRVVYEQAREYEHALLAWADAIDGKAATIFGVAAIVAVLSSTLGRVPSAGVGRVLWLAALVLWALHRSPAGSPSGPAATRSAPCRNSFSRPSGQR